MKAYTISELKKHTKEHKQCGNESENSYRRGYWDGVYAATELVDSGATNRQLKNWLWSALNKWRRKPLSQSPPPPIPEPWGKIRRRILNRDNHTCHYCNDKATHVDHVLAVSNGGSYEDSNLVAACKGCNLSKGSKYLADWRIK